jgi:DNA-binding SARP family transcriptional activator
VLEQRHGHGRGHTGAEQQLAVRDRVDRPGQLGRPGGAGQHAADAGAQCRQHGRVVALRAERDQAEVGAPVQRGQLCIGRAAVPGRHLQHQHVGPARLRRSAAAPRVSASPISRTPAAAPRAAHSPSRNTGCRSTTTTRIAGSPTPDQVVSVDRLIHELWGDRPPRSAATTIRAYVLRLRRVLGAALAADALLTRARGYELVTGCGDLDAAAFDELVAAGRRCLAEGRLDAALAGLSGGLALWHGSALADVPASPTVTAAAARLERSRLGALEDRAVVLLDLGRQLDVVDELPALVEAHPLHERLHGSLMLALYRAGRRGEALSAYQRARRVLRTELGLEPSPQLRELHQAMLQDERDAAEPARVGAGPARAAAESRLPAARRAPVPAQLPADVPGFVGRSTELDRLDALAGRLDGASAALVAGVLDGPPGVGKTALAVHWAHRVRNRFPDGQLYVNLRAHAAAPPVRPADALAGFLAALGVPAAEVPADADRAAAQYRTELSGRRMLIVLDDVGDAEQVRPLLPGGPGCLVLVTGRDEPAGLVARDGADRITLGPLAPAEAHALLGELLGGSGAPARRGHPAGHPAAQPAVLAEAVLAELASRCGYLPLALRIAAAHLSRPAADPGRYADQLAAAGWLTALEAGGDPDTSVRVAFDRSYARLPAGAQRLFRLLGRLPGPEVTVPAAADLAGLDPAGATRLLDRLATAHLVDRCGPGRYAVADLLRRYAADRCATPTRTHPHHRAARPPPMTAARHPARSRRGPDPPRPRSEPPWPPSAPDRPWPGPE